MFFFVFLVLVGTGRLGGQDLDQLIEQEADVVAEEAPPEKAPRPKTKAYDKETGHLDSSARYADLISPNCTQHYPVLPSFT